MLNIHNARFVKSAAAKQDFLFDGKPLILLAGRSNVGKSSVINSLLNRKNFARVGTSPGKTTQINYFCIDEAAYLVDLPGYGYAKRSFSERDRWAALIDDFFIHCARNVLANAFGLLIIDARHGPQDADFTIARLPAHFRAAKRFCSIPPKRGRAGRNCWTGSTDSQISIRQKRTESIKTPDADVQTLRRVFFLHSRKTSFAVQAEKTCNFRFVTDKFETHNQTE